MNYIYLPQSARGIVYIFHTFVRVFTLYPVDNLWITCVYFSLEWEYNITTIIGSSLRSHRRRGCPPPHPKGNGMCYV